MKGLTKEQMNERVTELTKTLDNTPSWSEEWNKAYDEYCNLRNELDEIYRQENQDDFNKFYEEHIKGKAWNEIDPDDWDWYSDWHKDMYGYRPRFI